MTLPPRQRAELTRRVARAHAEVLRRRYGGNWIVVPEPLPAVEDDRRAIVAPAIKGQDPAAPSVQ